MTGGLPWGKRPMTKAASLKGGSSCSEKSKQKIRPNDHADRSAGAKRNRERSHSPRQYRSLGLNCRSDSSRKKKLKRHFVGDLANESTARGGRGRTDFERCRQRYFIATSGKGRRESQAQEEGLDEPGKELAGPKKEKQIEGTQ